MRRDRESAATWHGAAGARRRTAGGRGTSPRREEPARQSSIRRLRRLSNWTAAALIVGTGSATWALAQHVTATATAQTVATGTAWTTTGTAVSAQGAGPNVTGPVAVSSGSGVVAPAGSAKGTSGASGAAQAPLAAAPQVSRTGRGVQRVRCDRDEDPGGERPDRHHGPAHRAGR